MKFLSLCSGIEAASVAWNPLGWEAVAFSEIEPFPNSVLAHHYPNVPNLGDMTKYHEWNISTIDLLCGGTPCQAFSVAGLRGGLADPRGNLTLTFLGAVDRFRPRWVVWENVPGILSDESRAFGAFLGGLGQLGYGFAYRILNAQYCGVPQRRRRIIVVGYLGDWRPPAAVLFERHSLQGHSAPGGKAGKEITGTLGSRASSGGGFSTDFEADGGLIPAISPTVSAKWAKSAGGPAGDECQNLIIAFQGGVSPAEGWGSLTASQGRSLHSGGLPCIAYRTAGDGGIYEEGDVIAPLTTGSDQSSNILAFNVASQNSNGMKCLGPSGAAKEAEVTRCLDGAGFTHNQGGTVVAGPRYGVRRLTPLECERLQGFPDNYTLVKHGKKMAADGPRYKAIGNSWAVPVFRWVGRRIQIVEKVLTK